LTINRSNERIKGNALDHSGNSGHSLATWFCTQGWWWTDSPDSGNRSDSADCAIDYGAAGLNDFSEGAARMVAKIIQEQEEACDRQRY
jgi:hypothetical protein